MSGMMGPEWLAIFFGIVMLAASAYAIFRIVVSWTTGRATDYAVEACHALMGISMAGMLVPVLGIVQPGISVWIWIVLSALVTIWFVVSVVQDIATTRPERVNGVRRVHHLPHAVLSAAMVYMLVVTTMTKPASVHGANSGAMAMQQSALVPGASLDLLLVFFMLGYLVILIDRLPYASAQGIGRPRVLANSVQVQVLYAPRGAAVLGIVMSAGMAYMLIMMFA